MRFVYIAHPIAGNVERNLYRVEKIVQHIMQTDLTVWPIAPYSHAVRFLEDNNVEHRLRAFQANKKFFSNRIIDELWICGGISTGVIQEAVWAGEFGINWCIKDFKHIFCELEA